MEMRHCSSHIFIVGSRVWRRSGCNQTCYLGPELIADFEYRAAWWNKWRERLQLQGRWAHLEFVTLAGFHHDNACYPAHIHLASFPTHKRASLAITGVKSGHDACCKGCAGLERSHHLLAHHLCLDVSGKQVWKHHSWLPGRRQGEVAQGRCDLRGWVAEGQIETLGAWRKPTPYSENGIELISFHFGLLFWKMGIRLAWQVCFQDCMW